MALTMSSRSLLRQRCMSWSVWLVRYSWGEYCGGWVTFAWRMALNVVTQCSWAVAQNCFSPWRLHRCSSWVVGFMPVEIPQVQFLGEVVFMPVACRQFWGTTVQKTVESPQLQYCHGGRCPCLCSSSRLWMSLCLCRDSGALAGGASDSVHRRSWWTFQLQRRGFIEG